MKSINKIGVSILLGGLVFSGTGCKKYLEEYNPSSRTAETYYNTAAGYEDLVKADYANLRYLVSFHSLFSLGTDLFSSYNTTDNNSLNLYNSTFTSTNTDVDGFWKQAYYAIGTANTTLSYAETVTGMDATVLATRKGEAKALRAYYYYLLTEMFGDIPIITRVNSTPSYSLTRDAQKDVFDQIIKDLTEAIDVLPVTTTDFGRMTKPAAQHLLAKVYLSRGYKSFGAGQADFTQAATLADAVINTSGKALKTSFADLFNPNISGFQVNTEVLFSVQYSTTVATNPVTYMGVQQYVGNALYQNFLWDMQTYAAIGRSAYYGKPNNISSPVPFFFNNYDRKRDSRFTASVWNVITAQTVAIGFAVGDTVIFFPDSAWTTAQKAAVKYTVLNPDEYRNPPITTVLTRIYPQFKKFREINISYTDAGGNRDTYIWRLGETYLIAAEAYMKAGNTSKGLTYFNAIRTRAAKTGNNPQTGIAYATEMQATTLTIDDILDERARELAGEEFRWIELKRTGKLVERVLAHNDEAKKANTIKEFHNLRPIPQSQIDLNREAVLSQNPGY